jgi:hypothetical protein
VRDQDLLFQVDRTGRWVRVRVTHMPSGASAEAAGQSGEFRLREAALRELTEKINQ